LRILITSAKEACSFELAFLLNEHQLFFGEENIPNHKFPVVESLSFAHELLSFCLDFEIEKVFPARAGELSSLMPAKILFKEFGIEIIAPDILSDFVYDTNSYQVNNFNELSGQLISLGYPNQQFAIAQANMLGDFLVINDEKKDFKGLWSKLREVSFVQIGKLFNQSDFVPLMIYPISGSLQVLNVLFENDELSISQNINLELYDSIFSLLKSHKSKGFYQVFLNGKKILRVKNVAY